MAMELKHLNPQHVMDVTGKAKDEISRLRAENAELKQELEEKDAFIKTLGEGQADLAREIERLKAKLEDAKATAYAESVDAGMENRRLKRALWLSRTEMARTSAWVFWNRNDDYNYNKWKKVERKCLKKAEEYK